MINKTLLSTTVFNITVAEDLTSEWIIEESETKKWHVKLGVHNPETQIEFTSENDVKQLMEPLLRNNQNYWSVLLTAAEQKVADTPSEKAVVRDKRDALLNKYEWTVTSPDLTDDKKAEWKTYRQALRDLPDQSGFPWEADGMTWPTKPTS